MTSSRRGSGNPSVARHRANLPPKQYSESCSQTSSDSESPYDSQTYPRDSYVKVARDLGNAAARELGPSGRPLPRPQLASALQKSFGPPPRRGRNEGTRPAVRVFEVPQGQASSSRRSSHGQRSDRHRHRRRRSRFPRVVDSLKRLFLEQRLVMLMLAIITPFLYSSYNTYRRPWGNAPGSYSKGASSSGKVSRYKAEVHPIVDAMHNLYHALPNVADSVPLTVGDVATAPDKQEDSSIAHIANASLEHFFHDTSMLLASIHQADAISRDNTADPHDSQSWQAEVLEVPDSVLEMAFTVQDAWEKVSGGIARVVDQSSEALEFLSLYVRLETLHDLGDRKKKKKNLNNRHRFSRNNGNEQAEATAATADFVLAGIGKSFGDEREDGPGLRVGAARARGDLARLLHALAGVTDYARTAVAPYACTADMKPDWNWKAADAAQDAISRRCVLKDRAPTLKRVSGALYTVDWALYEIGKQYLDPITDGAKKLQQTPMPARAVSLPASSSDSWDKCTEKDLPQLLTQVRVSGRPPVDGAWVVLDKDEKLKTSRKQATVYFFPPENCTQRLLSSLWAEYGDATREYRRRWLAARSEYQKWKNSVGEEFMGEGKKLRDKYDLKRRLMMKDEISKEERIASEEFRKEREKREAEMLADMKGKETKEGDRESADGKVTVITVTTVESWVP